MTVTATSSTTQTSSAAASTASNQLQGTTSEFLQLFMAQLQNQDPLDPQSGSDMVAQLAQLSTVEGQQTTNSDLSSLLAASTSQSNAQLAGLVGHTCDVQTGAFTIGTSGTGTPPIDISSSAPTKGAAVVITDANGNVVRRIAIPDGSTSTTVQWDGNNASGTPVPPGSYNVAVDPGSSSSTITSTWHGRIDAVQLGTNGAQLQMGDLLFAPGAVESIGMAGTTSASTSTTIPTTTTPATGAQA